MTFIDEAVVEFLSGAGGDGSASFHREKFVPHGGPNGADGGRGGHVILVADHHQRTLYDLRLKRTVRSEAGTHARGNKMGKDAPDVVVKVPVGTVVTDAESSEVLADLSLDGMTCILCKGGKGGLGNLHYTNSVRQAPTFAQNGAPGERVLAKLELKLLADVGLIGLPNAGKSTLLASVTAAKPKVADYPFTTITPNLGVVSIGNASFTIADLPGLIEGASEGQGLGHQFLKHAERTKVLIHVVEILPTDGSDPVDNFALIRQELKSYSESLATRPTIVALSKIDLTAPSEVQALAERIAQASGNEVFPISAATHSGLEPLLYRMKEALDLALAQPEPVFSPVLKPKADDQWVVRRVNRDFVVTGARIERTVAMTPLGNHEALRHLHRRLDRIGLLDDLRKAGVQNGDTVRIGSWEFEFAEDE